MQYDSIPDLEDDQLSSDGDSDIEPDLPAGMEGAALASRLPPDRLSKQEQQFFSDITTGNQQMLAEYLFIRNKIVSVSSLSLLPSLPVCVCACVCATQL